MFPLTSAINQETSGPLGSAASAPERSRAATSSSDNVATQPAQSAAAIQPSGQGAMRLALAELGDAASNLSQPDTWRRMQVAPASTPAMSVSAPAGKAGVYSVAIDRLATGQQVSSGTFSSFSTVVGIGTLDIQMGSWNGSMSTFSTNPNWPKASVVLGPKDTSLDVIRDRINAAGVGVVATVVSDATGSRLVLRSTGTGAANGFKVEATADPSADPAMAEIMASLNFNPGSGQASMALQQAAQDGQLRIDDRAIQSASNLVADAASGLDITMMSPTVAPQVLAVRPDAEAVTRNVSTLVDRFNQVTGGLNTPVAAPTLRNLQEQVRVQQPELAAQGIAVDARGRLQLDEGRLRQALLEAPAAAEQVLGDAGLGGALVRALKVDGEALSRPRAMQGYAPTSNNIAADKLPTGSVVSIEA